MLVAERYSVVDPKLNTGTCVNQKPRPRWKRIILIKMIGVILSLVLFNIILQALVVQRNHELITERDEIHNLERELNKMQVEIAALTSYERIQFLAKNELGMKIATPGDYRRIAAAPVVNQEMPRIYRQTMWRRLQAWVGNVGETLANTP